MRILSNLWFKDTSLPNDKYATPVKQYKSPLLGRIANFINKAFKDGDTYYEKSSVMKSVKNEIENRGFYISKRHEKELMKKMHAHVKDKTELEDAVEHMVHTVLHDPELVEMSQKDLEKELIIFLENPEKKLSGKLKNFLLTSTFEGPAETITLLMRYLPELENQPEFKKLEVENKNLHWQALLGRIESNYQAAINTLNESTVSQDAEKYYVNLSFAAIYFVSHSVIQDQVDTSLLPDIENQELFYFLFHVLCTASGHEDLAQEMLEYHGIAVEDLKNVWENTPAPFQISMRRQLPPEAQKKLGQILYEDEIEFEEISGNQVFRAVKLGNTNLVLKTGDLTNERADVIVNAANKKLKHGGGVCGAIYKAAGSQPFNECKQYHGISAGSAIMSSAGKLTEKGVQGIIHAVGPDCRIKEERENKKALLKGAYEASLNQAIENNMQTIAFCSLSTAIFGYEPIEEAAEIAFETIKEFIKTHPTAFQEVRFVFLPDHQDPQHTAEKFEAKLIELTELTLRTEERHLD